MAYQQTPLCVPHFLAFARGHFPRTANFAISDGVKDQEANLPGKPFSPRRVQPRRAAKDVAPSYAESSKRQRTTTPVGGVEKSEKRKIVTRMFPGNVSALKAKILAKEKELRDEDDSKEQENCKPWECDKCQQEAAEKLREKSLKTGTKRPRSPDASMEPAATGSMSSEWKIEDIPASHMFSWKDEKFAVDVCGETMVLMF